MKKLYNPPPPEVSNKETINLTVLSLAFIFAYNLIHYFSAEYNG